MKEFFVNNEWYINIQFTYWFHVAQSNQIDSILLITVVFYILLFRYKIYAFSRVIHLWNIQSRLQVLILKILSFFIFEREHSVCCFAWWFELVPGWSGRILFGSELLCLEIRWRWRLCNDGYFTSEETKVGLSRNRSALLWPV